MAFAPASVARPVSRAGVAFLTGLIRLYRLLLSPWMAPSCRFVPSCSEYAEHALRQHGPLRGGWLAARRLVRCHPWGGSGLDEVPDSCGCKAANQIL